MTEFEKWESGDACNVPPDADCCDMDCHDACRKIKATGWRAALEWLKNKVGPSGKYHLTNKGICILIEQELGDT